MYRYLQVDYISAENGDVETDLLRMNPDFHNNVRYDCVLIQATNTTFTLGRLVAVIGYTPDNHPHELQYAVVIPFDVHISRRGIDAGTRENQKRCRHLRFKQVRSRKASDSVIIPVESIVRGALLIEDFGGHYADEFILMDVVDADWFLRMRVHGLGDMLVSNAF